MTALFAFFLLRCAQYTRCVTLCALRYAALRSSQRKLFLFTLFCCCDLRYALFNMRYAALRFVLCVTLNVFYLIDCIFDQGCVALSIRCVTLSMNKKSFFLYYALRSVYTALRYAMLSLIDHP